MVPATETKNTSMTEPNEYAQLLRAIGQALEVLQFGSFTMEFTGGDFLVRGSAATSTEQEEARAIREKVIKFVWEALPGERASEAEIEFAMSTWPAELDLRYTRKRHGSIGATGKSEATEYRRRTGRRQSISAPSHNRRLCCAKKGPISKDRSL